MPNNPDKLFEISDVFEQDLPEDAWKVRPCEWYKDEHKECSSMRGRFHQFYIYGETVDCSQWKKDYQDCIMFRKKKDMKLIANIIKSENQRKEAREAAVVSNDTWIYRSKPPENWNSKMPDWMIENKKNSLLIETQRNLDEGSEPPKIFTGISCSIL